MVSVVAEGQSPAEAEKIRVLETRIHFAVLVSGLNLITC